MANSGQVCTLFREDLWCKETGGNGGESQCHTVRSKLGFMLVCGSYENEYGRFYGSEICRGILCRGRRQLEQGIKWGKRELGDETPWFIHGRQFREGIPQDAVVS